MHDETIEFKKRIELSDTFNINMGRIADNLYEGIYHQPLGRTLPHNELEIVLGHNLNTNLRCYELSRIIAQRSITNDAATAAYLDQRAQYVLEMYKTNDFKEMPRDYVFDTAGSLENAEGCASDERSEHESELSRRRCLKHKRKHIKGITALK